VIAPFQEEITGTPKQKKLWHSRVEKSTLFLLEKREKNDLRKSEISPV